MKHEQITSQIIKAALRVHSILGPGLPESAYRACLAHELRASGVQVQSEIPIPIVYDGVTIDVGYRIDLIVEQCVVVELETVEKLIPVQRAQLLSYLRLSTVSTGLLINFHVARLRDGITRVAN